MKKCPKCGAQINDDDKYCIFCGENVELVEENNFVDSLTCKYCHYPIKKDDVFCPHCGMEIKGSGSEFFNEGRREYRDDINDRQYQSIWSTIPLFFKNLINFKGRSTRREYWFPIIVIPMIFSILLSTINTIFPQTIIYYNYTIPSDIMALYGDIISIYTDSNVIQITLIDTIFESLFELFTIPILIRRLRDTGKNPWCILCYLIPIIGPIMIFIWSIMPTDRYRR